MQGVRIKMIAGKRAIINLQAARLSALFLYALLMLPFGIAVHILSELNARGFARCDSAFFVQHAYLFAIEFFAMAGFLVGRARCSSQELRRRVRWYSQKLPLAGRGRRFLLLSTLCQWLFALATMRCEGGALAPAEFATAALTAIGLAVAGSTVLHLLPARIIAELCGVYIARAVLAAPFIDIAQSLAVHITRDLHRSGFAMVVGNRPPPLAAHA